MLALVALGACGSSSGGPAATSATSTTATIAAPSTTTASPSSLSTTAAPSTTGTTATSSATSPTVPAAYQGRWNIRQADCGTVSEGQLTVEAGRISFFESSGLVTGVTVSGSSITVTMQLTGEGSTRTDVRRFTVSADGGQLTDLTTGTTRYRCPA